MNRTRKRFSLARSQRQLADVLLWIYPSVVDVARQFRDDGYAPSHEYRRFGRRVQNALVEAGRLSRPRPC